MDLQLSIATSEYDHIVDIALGRIRPEGMTLNYQIYPIEETFHRFVLYKEWDISEMSFAKFVSVMSGDRPDIIGLPVFTSRVFRLASVYVRRSSDIKRGEDLAGKRVGIPEWAQTAVIYTRGWLADDLGIKLRDIDWYQAGLNEPGRREKVSLTLPEGVKLTAVAERSLTQLLRNGDIDAFISARPPAEIGDPDKTIVPLFADPAGVELDYFRRTRILPIMHTIAIRRQVYDRNPWIAQNLFKAFLEARERSLARILDRQASRLFVPWLADYVGGIRSEFGKDFFPYGIAENRTTLEAFLGWCADQGIARRRLKPEELFAPETSTRFHV